MKMKRKKIRRDKKAMTGFITSVILAIFAIVLALKMNDIWFYFAIASIISIGFAIFRAEKIMRS